MTHRIGIVAHTARADQAHALQEQVGAVFLSMSNGNLNCEANHRRCWSWLAEHSGDADWLIVIEDDCVPAPDFTHQLEMVLEAAPTEVVSLYLGTSRPPQWQSHATSAVLHANTTDAAFIAAPALLHAVAVCIKTPLVTEMLDHTATLDDPVDEAITHWTQTTGRMIGYTHPSIVDHQDHDTLITHRDQHPRTQPRKAHQHGTRQHWTNQYVVMS